MLPRFDNIGPDICVWHVFHLFLVNIVMGLISSTESLNGTSGNGHKMIVLVNKNKSLDPLRAKKIFIRKVGDRPYLGFCY